jgi:alpha-L-rhamnosidase
MVLVPWNVYKFYGDKHILEENYESMKLYVNKIKSVAKDNLTDTLAFDSQLVYFYT